jgi:hypothetical protein
MSEWPDTELERFIDCGGSTLFDLFDFAGGVSVPPADFVSLSRDGLMLRLVASTILGHAY